MENQSFYDIGSVYSSGRKIEITPQYVMHLKKKAVLRLERKLVRHDPQHAAIIMDHVLAYLSIKKPSKADLFRTYLVEIKKLNAFRLGYGLSALTPIADSTFGRLANFTPVLKLACRESVSLAQSAVRLEWDDILHPAALTDNGSAFKPPIALFDAMRAEAASASDPTA